MKTYKGPQYYRNPNYQSIKDLINRSCEVYENKTAIVYRDHPKAEPTRISYALFHEQILCTAQLLARESQRQGLPLRELKVAIQGVNSYPWILSYFGTVMGPATVVPLDCLLEGQETLSLLSRSGANVYCGDARNFMKWMDEHKTLPHLKTVYLINEHKLNAKQRTELETWRRIHRHELRVFNFEHSFDAQERASMQPLLEIEDPDPDAPQILIFTSGTTSQAKGVLLSQRNIAANVNQLRGVVKFKRGLHILSILPLSHCFESTTGFMTGFSFGARYHLCDGLRYISKNFQEYKIDMVVAVPAIFESIWRQVEQGIKRQNKEESFEKGLRISKFFRKLKIDLRPLIFRSIRKNLGSLKTAIVGAAPMRREIIEKFDDIGIRLLQGYGLTEAAPVVLGCNSKVFVPGTVGVPLAGIEVAIDSDEEGEPGELLVRGDNVTKYGYFNDPEETAHILPGDGWLHTGDLATIDPESGCFVITGRLKSVIVLDSGKKVFPEEIEDMLRKRGEDFIRQSMVFAGEDERGESMVSAKFVIQAGPDTPRFEDENSIAQWLEDIVEEVNEQLPSFKRIRTWFYSFSDMITTTTMKVRRTAEEDQIHDIMSNHGLSLRDLNRQNIDRVQEGKPQDGDAETGAAAGAQEKTETPRTGSGSSSSSSSSSSSESRTGKEGGSSSPDDEKDSSRD